MVAQLALLANGWTIHESRTVEAYDILGKDPVNGEYAKIQVKTIMRRKEHPDKFVVHAKKGNGTAYDRSEADYIIGVWAADGEPPRVYMFENRMIGEYWCSEAKASERWVELPIALNRQLQVLDAVTAEVAS